MTEKRQKKTEKNHAEQSKIVACRDIINEDLSRTPGNEICEKTCAPMLLDKAHDDVSKSNKSNYISLLQPPVLPRIGRNLITGNQAVAFTL